MDIDALKSEIDADPLVRGYSGMTDAQVADSLNNTIDRNVNKTSISGADIFRNVDATEFNALTADNRREVLQLCAVSEVDPFGPATTIIQAIFPPAGATITTLQAYRVDTVSRATELGLGKVAEGHVNEARRLP